MSGFNWNGLHKIFDIRVKFPKSSLQSVESDYTPQTGNVRDYFDFDQDGCSYSCNVVRWPFAFQIPGFLLVKIYHLIEHLFQTRYDHARKYLDFRRFLINSLTATIVVDTSFSIRRCIKCLEPSKLGHRLADLATQFMQWPIYRVWVKLAEMRRVFGGGRIRWALLPVREYRRISCTANSIWPIVFSDLLRFASDHKTSDWSWRFKSTSVRVWRYSSSSCSDGSRGSRQWRQLRRSKSWANRISI